MKQFIDLERWKALFTLDVHQASAELAAASQEEAEVVAAELGVPYLVRVVTGLTTDTASEFLRNLSEEVRQEVLSSVPEEKAKDLREVFSYAPDTAGALMAKEFLSVPVGSTIQEATAYLQSLSPDRKGRISYIYAVDKNRRLEGVIQIRDLIFHSADRPIREILKRPVVQVETGMSPLDVARLLQRHHYLGLPVVDASQRLVGVISADSALKVLEDEASDEIAKIVGTGAEEIRTRSVRRIYRLRLPWLLVNIASGLFCAAILNAFQSGVENVAILFLFIPIVLGLSESIGVQGATIVVRNISLGHVELRELRGLFTRELAVGVFIALTCGAIVGLVAWFWQGFYKIGFALAASMIVAMFISSLIGLVLPVIFKRTKVDPAMASGPIVLAICDIQTLFVYFAIATMILRP